MTDNKEKEGVIKFELKEIITMVTLLVSILFGYFGIIKDIETRLVRIETQIENIKHRSGGRMMDPPTQDIQE